MRETLVVSGRVSPAGLGGTGEVGSELLFLHAQTALHPGTGQTLGVVDLPVQRERHTGWPVIAGSSLKGILREACRRRVRGRKGDGNGAVADADPDVVAVFGPPAGEEAEKHAGALAVADARILAFPVRSLRGVFAWISCSAVLERLNRDLALAGYPPAGTVPQPARGKAACPAGSPLLVAGDRLVLEEFEFTRSGDDQVVKIASWISGAAVADEATRSRLGACFAILHDDDFTYFVRHATELVARIRLDYVRKTVSKGALFCQEFLPAETIFYALLLSGGSRRQEDQRDGPAILDLVRRNLPPAIQIGGDETIGKGICTVRMTSRSGGAAGEGGSGA